LKHSPFQIDINGVKVSFASYAEILEVIDRSISIQSQTSIIGYVNANTIVLSHNDHVFKKALNNHSISYADGFGMHLAAKILNHDTPGFIQNHNASDFNDELFRYADRKKFKIYFVGTNQFSLARLKEKLGKVYPNIGLAGLCDGYDGIMKDTVIESINNSGADILIVGMGNPKQELWLYKNRELLKVPVCITVGAYLDFVSGVILRAPIFIRSLRLEWLFRLVQEPRRLWKRYILGIPSFIVIIIKQRLGE
jgi:N-acetylglucosaminyldiphosphoundecaprenol N-acetyl-beta-D-mannosaminyltransferase